MLSKEFDRNYWKQAWYFFWKN